MFKKFFVAVILGLLVISSQIVSAADVDWNSAPRIGSKAQFARYIESERRKGNTRFRIVLTNGFKIMDKEHFANLALCLGVNGSWHDNLDGTMQIDYKITEYPGTRVANAYRNGDTSNLTADEKKLYRLAVGIVNEANKRTSEVEKARYIHDEICKRVIKYQSHTNEDAIGALVIGITNCNGYTDAFYMLGRMSGLNVGRIRGTINNGTTNHGWNWITFKDGKSYCVDVTLDDTQNSTEWFLANFEIMRCNHVCEYEIIPNLQ